MEDEIEGRSWQMQDENLVGVCYGGTLAASVLLQSMSREIPVESRREGLSRDHWICRCRPELDPHQFSGCLARTKYVYVRTFNYVLLQISFMPYFVQLLHQV